MRSQRGTRIALVIMAAGALTAPIVAVPASAGGGGGCYEGATDGARSTVVLKESCFAPTINRVSVGTKVTWINRDPYPHVVTGDVWGSPDDLQQGGRYSTVFRAPGVYPYTCYLHPGMIGAVIVGDTVASDVGAGELTPLDDEINGGDTGQRAATKPLSTRPAVTTSSPGPWPATTAIGFALALLFGLLLIVQRRRGPGTANPES